jgi:hypothetical protein
LGMASRVGLTCDERMGKVHEEDPFKYREEPSRIITIRECLKAEGIPERCCFAHPYAFHMVMMIMMIALSQCDELHAGKVSI